MWHKEKHGLQTTQGKLVEPSLVLVGHFGCFLPYSGKQREHRDQGFTGVFSVSLSDSAGCTVSAHVCSSGGAVMQLRNKYSNRQE